jgi:hypothetical protein
VGAHLSVTPNTCFLLVEWVDVRCHRGRRGLKLLGADSVAGHIHLLAMCAVRSHPARDCPSLSVARLTFATVHVKLFPRSELRHTRHHAGAAFHHRVDVVAAAICSHMKRRDRSPCLKLQKPDGPVWQTGLSSFIATDDSQRCRWALTRCSSSDQVASIWWRGVNHNNFEGCGGG